MTRVALMALTIFYSTIRQEAEPMFYSRTTSNQPTSSNRVRVNPPVSLFRRASCPRLISSTTMTSAASALPAWRHPDLSGALRNFSRPNAREIWGNIGKDSQSHHVPCVSIPQGIARCSSALPPDLPPRAHQSTSPCCASSSRRVALLSGSCSSARGFDPATRRLSRPFGFPA
jgi:hypothetical protein